MSAQVCTKSSDIAPSLRVHAVFMQLRPGFVARGADTAARSGAGVDEEEGGGGRREGGLNRRVS